MSNYVGPELTASLSALFSLASVVLLLKVWQPRREFRSARRRTPPSPRRPTRRRALARAYGTYGILIVVVLIGQIGNFAGLSTLKPPLNVTALLRCGQVGYRAVPRPVGRAERGRRPAGASFPGLGVPLARRLPARRRAGPTALVQREPPVVAASSPYPLTYRLDFLAAAGTLVFVAALRRLRPDVAGRCAARACWDRHSPRTLRQLRLPIVTIAFILSISTRDELLGDDLVDGAGARQDRRASSRSSPRGSA